MVMSSVPLAPHTGHVSECMFLHLYSNEASWVHVFVFTPRQRHLAKSKVITFPTCCQRSSQQCRLQLTSLSHIAIYGPSGYGVCTVLDITVLRTKTFVLISEVSLFQGENYVIHITELVDRLSVGKVVDTI